MFGLSLDDLHAALLCDMAHLRDRTERTVPFLL